MATMVGSIKKAITGTQPQPLEVYEREVQELQAEIRRLDGVLANGDVTVDELEAAITRKNALQIRLGAVRKKMGTDAAQMKEEQRLAMEQQGKALKAAALATCDGLLEPMLALFNAIGQIHTGLIAADGLLEKSWNEPRAYWHMAVRHMPMSGLRETLGRELVAKWPERFTWTAKGVVDKQGEIV